MAPWHQSCVPCQLPSRSFEGAIATLSLSCAATAAKRVHKERDTTPYTAALVVALGSGDGAAVPRHTVMAPPTTLVAWPLSRMAATAGCRAGYAPRSGINRSRCDGALPNWQALSCGRRRLIAASPGNGACCNNTPSLRQIGVQTHRLVELN